MVDVEEYLSGHIEIQSFKSSFCLLSFFIWVGFLSFGLGGL